MERKRTKDVTHLCGAQDEPSNAFVFSFLVSGLLMEYERERPDETQKIQRNFRSSANKASNFGGGGASKI